jgi:Ca2+-transporting ATPase
VLLGLVALTAVLQLLAIYVPFLDQFFQITPLNGLELLLCVGLGGLMLMLIELEKALLRRGR